MSDRRILLNPGPVTLSARVRDAVPGPDLCHREDEYAELQSEIRRRLLDVHPGTDGCSTVLVSGSGTAAVEAMVGSVAAADRTAVVAANGVYGERIASILERQGKPVVTVTCAWTDPIDIDAVERAIERADPPPSCVVAVHHETTTGRLNDLARLGALCRSTGVPLFVDAVSSFAGEALDLRGLGIAGCAATANKCLHGIPGIAFVVADDGVIDAATHATGVYLDLRRNWSQQQTGYPLFTPAIPSMVGLREALDELDDGGGWETRRDDYRRRSTIVRDGLTDLGVKLLLPDVSDHSSMLTSYRLPRDHDFRAIYDHASRAGFVIYAGQAALMDEIFRIAVMGDITDDEMRRFVDVMAGLLD